MLTLKKLVLMDFVPQYTQCGLAVLRIFTGLNLFLHHGWEKNPSHWTEFMAHFPDPIGIGSHPSFIVAFLSDFVCGLLLIFGLGTRWAALFCFCNIFVAWAFVHHFIFFGKGPGPGHGELIFMYLAAMATLVLAGPGYLSVDRLLSRKS